MILSSYRSLKVLDAVSDFCFPGVFGTVGAAEDILPMFHAVTHDAAPAVCTERSQGMDRAFE
jgi:hypothetical protein